MLNEMHPEMVGILIVGGEGPSRTQLKDSLEIADYTVAADSGLELALRLGIQPDLVVGDMDSLSDKSLLNDIPAEKQRLYPVDKDETDTEIGLACLMERGVGRVTILGGGGGRMDHLIGILNLFEREFSPNVWITAREYVELIESEVRFVSAPGQLLSFFPVGESVEGMESDGLKWNLNGLIWKRGDGGISNVATGREVVVRVGKGKILMIKQLTR